MMRHWMAGWSGLCVLVLSVPALAGTWSLQHGGGGGGATAVAVVDANRVVAYGLAQQAGSDDAVPMWMSTNDGTNWKMTNAQGKTDGELLMISMMTCPRPSLCLATATSVDMSGAIPPPMTNAVLRSVDGGRTFTWPPIQQWMNKLWAFANIEFVSDAVIWLCNGPNVAAVKRPSDSTHQYEYLWKVPKVGDTQYQSILDIDFLDANVGFAVNGKEVEGQGGASTIEALGALLKTTDGGATWEAVYSERQELPVDLQVLSPDLLFLSGRTPSGPFLRRSEDGGRNWTELAIPAGAEPRNWTGVDVYRAFDRDTAYVIVGVPVGQESYAHTIFEMRDGATLVEVLPSPANHVGGFMAMDCMGPERCWAVGTDMMVLHYRGDDPLPGEDSGTVGPDGAMPDAAVMDAAEEVSGNDVPGHDSGAFPFDDGYIPRDLAGAGGEGGSGGCAAGAPALPGLLALGASLVALAGLRVRRGRRRQG